MKLGVIGVGTIASAMVDGLRASGWDAPIILSPRGADMAAALAARHADVRLADTNQAVLDACDLVVLAVRPQIADEVLAALRFRPDHHVLSLIAAVSLDHLRDRVAPATHVTRAVPLPAVAMRQGPTAIFPQDDAVVALFDRLGTAFVLHEEAEFDIFSAATATMASYFAFAGTIARWMEQGGVAVGTARAFVGRMLGGLAVTGPDRDFAELADEHQTRGGLNEQVVRLVAPDGSFAALDSALDAVLARLRR
ncbi:NADP oxidoreductase [Nostoc sp. 3335mG]|nr:NADP oxidoreductase [Nostoc sp. 3335mG]